MMHGVYDVRSRDLGVYSRQIESYRLHPGRIASTARAGLFSAGRETVDRSLRLLSSALADQDHILGLAVVEVSGGRSQVRSAGDADGVRQLNEMNRLAECLVDRVLEDDAVAYVDDGGRAVPIFAPDGHVVGAVVALTSVPMSADSAIMLHDTAVTIEDDVRLRDVSREFAGQLAADQVEDEVEASLASLATATSKSVTIPDVARAITTHGAQAIDATLISMATIEAGTLRFVHGEGVHEAVARSWVVSALDAPNPMAACLRQVQPVVLLDRASFDAWPMFRETGVELGLESFMAVPIVDREGVAMASIGVGWATPLDGSEVPLIVQRLAGIAAQALQRATQHETAQDHASVLQSIVLPERLPIAPGLEIHGRYLPPTFGQRVGGDLFDAWVRDDGAVAFVVADVAGHTLQATRTTAALRHSIGMLSLERRAPADVLSSVDRYLQNSETSRLATCCYGIVDSSRSLLTIANAGHPQPRLRNAAGEVSVVGPLGEVLLGFGAGAYTEVTVPFEPGASLVLFTDGLIERRSVDVRVAERSLDRQLAEVDSMTASEISALLLADLQGERDDDVVVMVIRRPNSTRKDNADLSITWSKESLALGEARAAIESWVANTDGVVDDCVDDLLLIGTELLTNARTAASAGSDIALTCSATQGRVQLAVQNTGAPFSHRPTMPVENSPRGRGLAIVAALADLSIDESEDGSVTVRAVLSPPPP